MGLGSDEDVLTDCLDELVVGHAMRLRLDNRDNCVSVIGEINPVHNK
jgi:hypothetical protein